MSSLSRVKELLERIALTGIRERGITRYALTDYDAQARSIVEEYMRKLGMKIRKDAACNLWGCLEGTSEEPGVVIGSHLDSVPEGGDYDGVLGVCAGLGVVRDILEQGRPRRSLYVVDFTAEESSRFSMACIGSKSITGNLTVMDTLFATDNDGISLFKAMRDFGGTPEFLPNDVISPAQFKSYFELHIEQGPVLDRNRENVGIVEAIAAPTRFMIDIKGEQAHSGACPMSLRRDALAAAAQIILDVESAGLNESEFGTVATVGVCECFPGALNVVPGHVILKVDLRGIVEKSIKRAYEEIIAKIKRVERARGVTCDVTLYCADTPVVMDGILAKNIERICQRKNFKYRRMPSGAGHDAMYMASLIPSALIFVPCKNGISHNPDEMIDWEAVRPGYEVLLEAVKEALD